jgi:hypothetical protein
MPLPPEERHTYDLWSGILIAKVLAMYADLAATSAWKARCTVS